jgi:hypothetical protein
LSAGWAFPLAAWNFYSQNFLAPFSTLTNTPIINWGYLLFIQLGGCTQSFFFWSFCLQNGSTDYCSTNKSWTLNFLPKNAYLTGMRT